MPKKNDIVRLTIERCGLAGEGISRLDGQVVFVSGGIPGEVCDVQLLKVGKTAIWGRVHALVDGSPARVAADCPVTPSAAAAVPPHALLRRAGGQTPAGGGRAPAHRGRRPPGFRNIRRGKYAPLPEQGPASRGPRPQDRLLPCPEPRRGQRGGLPAPAGDRFRPPPGRSGLDAGVGCARL